MNWVSAALATGLLGFFLVFTIYLQSVLGYSAIKAGLTLLPSSVVSVIVAPAAGKLTDKIGGKYIMIAGLALFSAGTGWAVLSAGPASAWYVFLPSGAASGLLNTMRQAGSVIGTAAVGALLQNRLVASLTSQATAHASVLPPTARTQFATRAGAPVKLPPGVPPSLAHEMAQIAATVFDQGYLQAMRWTMILPIMVIALAAITAFAVRQGPIAMADPGQDARQSRPASAPL